MNDFLELEWGAFALYPVMEEGISPDIISNSVIVPAVTGLIYLCRNMVCTTYSSDILHYLCVVHM